MDLGSLVAAHIENRDRAIFSYDELEASAAERWSRLAGAVARLRRLLTVRRSRTAALASRLPAE